MSTNEFPHYEQVPDDSLPTWDWNDSETELEGASKKDDSNGLKRTVEKVRAFESKHNIILNLIVVLCSVVVMCMSLFLPIKVQLYSMPVTEYSDKEQTISYVSVNQSVFQMIGVIPYINASKEKKADITDSYNKAMAKIEEKYSDWRASHLQASDGEARKALTEIVEECLSEINILGYMLATMESYDVLNGNLLNALLSALFGAGITILSIIMTVMSLVYLFSSIINMIKKRPQNKLYKYLAKILSMSTGGMVMMFCAPMFKVGGGMLAIALFSAIVYLLCAGIGELLFGKSKKSLVIKRIIIVAACSIAFFLLCGDVVTVVDPTGGLFTITTRVPTGYGLFSLIGMLDLKNWTHEDMHVANFTIGIIMYLLVAVLITALVMQTMKCSFRRLVYGDEKNTDVNGTAIGSAVIILISIIVGFYSDKITNTLVEFFWDMKDVDIKVKWLVNSQLWVSMFIMTAVVIFNKVFLPNDVFRNEKEVKQELPESF